MCRNMRKSERKHHKDNPYIAQNGQASIKKADLLPMTPSLILASQSMLCLCYNCLNITPGHTWPSGFNCKLLMDKA